MSNRQFQWKRVELGGEHQRRLEFLRHGSRRQTVLAVFGSACWIAAIALVFTASYAEGSDSVGQTEARQSTPPLVAESVNRDGRLVNEASKVPSVGGALLTANDHWAFRVPRKAARPAVRHSGWPQSDVDALIVHRLESHGVDPSLPASRHDIVRRLYYDLLGLPPSYEQMEQFLADSSPTAFEALVDQLLGSPHFGERWARHWLDVARFGDTKGYVFTESRDYPNAFKYRDWVIDALNRDVPIDRFLKLQLAADRMTEGTDSADLAALGYLTLGRRFINNKHDIIDDRIDVVFRGMMGLTVSCARCHDHKYDPVESRDYYAIYGVFASSPEHQEEGMPLRLKDAETPHDARIFLRGNPANQAEIAPRRFLSFFDRDGKPFEHGSGRLPLAEAIADKGNPLTARVFVNRVWGHLFGTPLVRTPSDFGIRTEPPLQQDVLDHLAATFVTDDRWSLKQLIRRIVSSSTYRQASHDRPDALHVDPVNALYWKANRKRLDFEAMRDSLLTASGTLDQTVGGPSARIETWPPTTRRTLYAFIDRQNLPNLFRTFDFASPDTHSPIRPKTVVPQQALFLLNSPFAHDVAERLADRTQTIDTRTHRVGALYQSIFARDPTEREVRLGESFVEQTLAGPDLLPPSDPWSFGYGLLRDDESVRFRPLPHFTGEAWQGGPNLPDPAIGWVILTAAGGHPGNDQDHAAIRRWVAPCDGSFSLRGMLRHPSDQGDGVRARVVVSQSGLAGTWDARHGQTRTACKPTPVRSGDTVDLMVDCRDHPTCDTFEWRVVLQFKPADGGQKKAFESELGYHGPLPEPLGVWARYAHTLLLTNEFLFLD